MTERGVIIGNCSGFYGDRLSAMREMLEGGPLDVLTGDYLAELTMLILGKDQLRDPSLGYARTFVRQLEDCLGLALEKGVRVVANAGGLNPAGLAERIGEIARGLGLAPRIGYVAGDNVISEGFDGALTANAYLGGFGIAAALGARADIVVTGRVTDASLVLGPAAWWHGWTPSSYDELAGAVVAGHVVECGTQATGGNFSGFLGLDRSRPLGFPIAVVEADGSSVITKHPGSGGAVTLDTVTAQLMYEIQGPAYLGPDVTTDLTSIALADAGPDRVRVSGVRGSEPPERLKVSVNTLGGYRNSVEFVLVGLDIDEKAAWVRAQLEAGLRQHPAVVAWSLDRRPVEDAETEEAASCLLRCTVQDESADVVGKAFSGAAVELALASYPGFTMTAPPGPATAYGVYRPAFLDRSRVTEQVVVDGRPVPLPTAVPAEPAPAIAEPRVVAPRTATSGPPSRDFGPAEPRVRVALGAFVNARSGDKGGDANVGLWVGEGPKREQRIGWLLETINVETVRTLIPESVGLDIETHPLPNLGGVNVVIHGLLGEGVAASTRFDPQAKALGEWVRARHLDVPEELL